MIACIHRGSQRRTTCCGGLPLQRWICRELKKDCVVTVQESDRQKMNMPEGRQKTWDESVAICEKCPHYRTKPPDE